MFENMLKFGKVVYICGDKRVVPHAVREF